MLRAQRLVALQQSVKGSFPSHIWQHWSQFLHYQPRLLSFSLENELCNQEREESVSLREIVHLLQCGSQRQNQASFCCHGNSIKLAETEGKTCKASWPCRSPPRPSLVLLTKVWLGGMCWAAMILSKSVLAATVLECIPVGSLMPCSSNSLHGRVGTLHHPFLWTHGCHLTFLLVKGWS